MSFSRNVKPPTYTQADGEFIIDTNYSKESHQISFFTDSVPTAGTVTIYFESGEGRYLPIYINGEVNSIDLTDPKAVYLPIYTDSLKIVISGFDADKKIGYSIFSSDE